MSSTWVQLDFCVKKGETRDLPVLTIPTITRPNWLQIRWKVQETEVIKSTKFGLENHRVRRSIAFIRSHIFLSLDRKCIDLKADTVCYDLLNLPLVLHRSWL